MFRRYCAVMIILVTPFICLHCFAADVAPVKGSGVIITDTRKVATFNSLQLAGAFMTKISCQKGQQLQIRGDDNIVPLIRTEVQDGRLHIYTERSYSTESLLQLQIMVPDLKAVSVSGAHTVSVAGVANSSLVLDAGGASSFSVSGKTGILDAKLSGGSTIAARKLKADQVSVSIDGAGDAEVFATKKLAVQITGVGDVTYYGNPTEVTRQILGVGNITAK